ncbi:oligosaccharide flippase family protein [Anaerolineales bacterium HSG25]|nr:oligosaccharide flippase family protein [Anaerolineales bacterium HSG25]
MIKRLRLNQFGNNFLANGFLKGSALLFVSTTIVNIGNYLFNLVLGRWLGPSSFADLSLIITLLLVITLVTATLQTVVAKYAATYTVDKTLPRLVGLRDWLGKWAWGLGILFMLILGLGAPFLQQFFHTESAWPFLFLGIGIPMYFAQGVDRGILQGQMRFGLLALSYQAEMWVRLVVAIGLVLAGWSVNGAVFGVTCSLVVTWLVARQAKVGLPKVGQLSHFERQRVILFTGSVIPALLGQIFINNSDILIVKRFFSSADAGQYAALALIGRIVFFATWSVVTVLFPIVAQKHQQKQPHRHLFWLSIGLVGGISVGIIVASFFFAEWIVWLLFGPAYLQVAPMLWLYAIATTLYAVANVIVTYWLSTGKGFGSFVVVGAGIAQIISLWLWHGSLLQVVWVQIYLMSALVSVLFLWDGWLQYRVRFRSKHL